MSIRSLLVPVLLLAPALAAADETRAVPPFTSLHVGSGFHARVTEGPLGPIRLGGPAEVLRHVRTEVRDGTLTVAIEPGARIETREKLTVEVRMPRADALAVSGAAQMDASVPCGDQLALSSSGAGQLRLTSAVRTQTLSIAASGGSTMTVASVEAGEAQLQLSGAARVTLTGRASSGALALSGGSELDAARFSVDSVVVNGSGGSRAAVRAGEVSAGSLSGGAQVRVPAAARLGAIASSGGGQVIRDL